MFFFHPIARVDVREFQLCLLFNILCFQISAVQLRLHPGGATHISGTLNISFSLIWDFTMAILISPLKKKKKTHVITAPFNHQHIVLFA